MVTRRWLHSHLYASPLSGNLEVSEGIPYILHANIYLENIGFEFSIPSDGPVVKIIVDLFMFIQMFAFSVYLNVCHEWHCL